MSEIRRSGFSDPESFNLTNVPPPSPPSDFQVDTWGLQSTGSPNELPQIRFKWLAPDTLALTVDDAYTDDIYDSGTTFGALSGIYSTNDTLLTMTDSATTAVVAGDRIYIGSDPTRYTVVSYSGTALEIQYGLLQDIAASGAVLKRLEFLAECSATHRLVTFDALDEDEVRIMAEFDETVFLSGGTSVSETIFLGWDVEGEALEWEDLGSIGQYLSNSVLAYATKDTGLTVSGSVAEGETVIPLDADPSGIITTSSTLYFDEDFDAGYTVDVVATQSVTLTTALATSLSSGATIHYAYTGTFADYNFIASGGFTGTKEIGDFLGGYNLYYDSGVTSASSPGDLFAALTGSDVSVGNDGYTSYTLNAPNENWSGQKLWFSLAAIDNNVPANESAYDTSPWVITTPTQAEILSATRSGTSLTITYKNITATGAVVTGTTNHQFLLNMSGASAQYSENAGYDVYLAEYAALTGGSYSGNNAASGAYLNTTLQVGDIVVLVDTVLQARWVVHCTVAGRVVINNGNQTTGTNPVSYIGTGAPSAANMTVKYARINRTTDSVLPISGGGNKQYLTDLQNTHVVTLDLNKDQAVVIESVDTLSDSGKD